MQDGGPACVEGTVRAQAARDCRRGNHINSRLRIKQYLWAIVIKGKFNSLLMSHYVWLGKVKLRLGSPFSGGRGHGESFSHRSAPIVVSASQQGPGEEGVKSSGLWIPKDSFLPTSRRILLWPHRYLPQLQGLMLQAALVPPRVGVWLREGCRWGQQGEL